MLYRYEIKNNGLEDILYLYLTLKTEFSKELLNNSDQREITRRTKNFIINNNINFNGNKVYLIVDGIVVKAIDISTTDFNVKSNFSYSNEGYLVNVKLEDKSISEMTLKDYLLGVIATLYNETLEYETLKCLSILYRTYAYKMMSENQSIDNNNDLFIYNNINNFKVSWLDKFEFNMKIISDAIDETDCVFLNYNDKYILPFVHVYNNGKTYANSEYPYLSSVSSLWDLANIYNKEVLDYTYDNFSKTLGIEVANTANIEVLKIGHDNSLINLRINDKVFTGEEFRRLLSLKSLNFNILLYRNFIRIITFGFGNNLGLSIYGANELAKDGHDYSNILKYYFPKVKLNKYIKELP